jgi:hypothetical protein
MATPFPFGSGNVLTAAQLNAITTLPVSTKTTSYTLTISDLGTRVVMNSASATTITINTSIFGASDVVEILNIGAGVCTVTAGTCTVGTSGTLALVQNAGGTLTFISASASVFRASGVAASSGAITLITAASFSAVTSVSLAADTFSTTYRNYKIIWQVDSTSANGNTTVRLRAAGADNTTNNYRQMEVGITQANSASNNAQDLQTTFQGFGQTNAMTFDCLSPKATAFTTLQGGYTDSNTSSIIGRTLNARFVATTSFDSLSFICSSGNFTGTYRVYGWADA